MKIWNFKKQDIEEGIQIPGCNGISGGNYDPILISYKGDGETNIISIKDKNDERSKTSKTNHLS